MSKTTRRALLGGFLGGSALLAKPALAAPALAQAGYRWRMVTSWPKNLPGPGVSAERIATDVATMSDGRLTLEVFPAGSLVGGLETFDAVSSGTVEMAHTASLFWQGKIAAAPFFTAVPFGLTPLEHAAWLESAGGQSLWDELYAPFGIKPYAAGNTGFQMGGWYRNPITTLDDLKGLKIRMPGFGGEVLRTLGASPVSMAPSEIFAGLQSGLIDATEFLGPFSDEAMGFFQVAPHYAYPGFHEPNGTGEALVSLPALGRLPEDLKAILEAVLAREAARALAEAEFANGVALKRLVETRGVTLFAFPDDVIAAAKVATQEVMGAFAERGPAEAAIVSSYYGARDVLSSWSRVSLAAYLSARS